MTFSCSSHQQELHAEKTIFQEMTELIGDITSLLDNIMRMYMSSAKRPMPTPSIPYPLGTSDLSLSAAGSYCSIIVHFK